MRMEKRFVVSGGKDAAVWGGGVGGRREGGWQSK